MDIKMPMVVEFVRLLYIEDGVIINPGAADQSQTKVGDVSEIRAIGSRFCCTDMSHHFRKGSVGFGLRKEEVYRNKVAEVFIRVEGGSQNDIAIPYCPWCREPVLTNEIASL